MPAKKTKKKVGRTLRDALGAAKNYFLDTSNNYSNMSKRPKNKGSYLKGAANYRKMGK